MTRKEYLKKKHKFLLDCMRQTAMERFPAENEHKTREDAWKAAFLLGALERHRRSDFAVIMREWCEVAEELTDIEDEEKPPCET